MLQISFWRSSAPAWPLQGGPAAAAAHRSGPRWPQQHRRSTALAPLLHQVPPPPRRTAALSRRGWCDTCGAACRCGRAPKSAGPACPGRRRAPAACASAWRRRRRAGSCARLTLTPASPGTAAVAAAHRLTLRCHWRRVKAAGRAVLLRMGDFAPSAACTSALISVQRQTVILAELLYAGAALMRTPAQAALPPQLAPDGAGKPKSHSIGVTRPRSDDLELGVQAWFAVTSNGYELA